MTTSPKSIAVEFEAILELYKKQSCDPIILNYLLSYCGKCIFQWPLDKQVMAKLFETVDELVFDQLLVKTLLFYNLKMDFSTSISKLNIAGQTKFVYGSSVIKFMLNDELFQLLFDESDHQYMAGGKQCTNRHSCFLEIFIHEMCHIFIYLYRTVNSLEDWPEKSHGKMFSFLCRRVFLQTEIRHALIPGFSAYADSNEIKTLAREHQQSGDAMEYFYDGQWLTVKIQKVKRIFATVSGENGTYDVPISLLRPK
jgi:hypothetical protein